MAMTKEAESEVLKALKEIRNADKDVVYTGARHNEEGETRFVIEVTPRLLPILAEQLAAHAGVELSPRLKRAQATTKKPATPRKRAAAKKDAA